MGICAPENGFTAKRPVKIPSFSAVAMSAAFVLRCFMAFSRASMAARPGTPASSLGSAGCEAESKIADTP